VSGITGDIYLTTSTSSNAISIPTTSLTYTVATGLAYTPVQSIIIVADDTDYMTATVTSYSGSTLIATVNTAFGSGTYTSWTINLDGATGGQGACGVSGVSGVAGACGVSGTTGSGGAAGACGVSGVAGACGVSGTAGSNGACGVSGVTGVPGFPPIAGTVSVTSNAGTASATYWMNNFTNSSASNMTITVGITSPTPNDKQPMVIYIYDFSGVAKTITWVNTENSTVTAPTTSNGSTTLPLTVGFIYNGQTSKWRCVAYT
jgi:hypothetical protein